MSANMSEGSAKLSEDLCKSWTEEPKKPKQPKPILAQSPPRQIRHLSNFPGNQIELSHTNTLGLRMKDWMITLIVDLLLKNLDADKIKKFAEAIQCFLLPVLRSQKTEIMKRLKEKAAKTNTVLDDAALDALDVFIESWLPDNSSCFLNLRK